MRGLMRRLQRLEHERAKVIPPCPGCTSDEPKTFRVTFGDEDAGPEYCAVCGRQLVYTLEFDDRG